MALLLSGSTVAALPGGSTTSGWYMYKGMLPDSSALPDKGIGLIETAGAGVMERVQMEQPGLQMVVRGDQLNSTSTDVYATAAAKMNQARDVLAGYAGSSGSIGVHYLGIWCQNQAFFGYDDTWRPIFISNFRVMKATS